jgi:uncharacterized protein YkwD
MSAKRMAGLKRQNVAKVKVGARSAAFSPRLAASPPCPMTPLESKPPMKALAVPLLAVTALAAGCATQPRPTRPLDGKAVERLAAVRVDPGAASRILNAYRAQNGLSPIRLDPALTAMAQHQADAMAAGNALSHDVGGSFSSRVHAAGIDAARTAENLGGGYYSTEEAFAGWRKSAGHDANLRMPQATRFGIALAKDPGTTYRAYWALVIAGEPEQRRTLDAGPTRSGGNLAQTARSR